MTKEGISILICISCRSSTPICTVCCSKSRAIRFEPVPCAYLFASHVPNPSIIYTITYTYSYFQETKQSHWVFSTRKDAEDRDTRATERSQRLTQVQAPDHLRTIAILPFCVGERRAKEEHLLFLPRAGSFCWGNNLTGRLFQHICSSLLFLTQRTGKNCDNEMVENGI
jgi:hypothetical protein